MKKYIVLVSMGIGGAEKRFYDIYRFCREQEDSFFLIIPETLASKLMVTKEDRNIITIKDNDSSFISFIKNYKSWLDGVSSNSSFIYPLNALFFLHFGKGHKVSMSLTNCFEAPRLFSFKKSLVRQWISMCFSNKIDVLNDNIFNSLKNTRFSSKIYLTPGGTFVNPSDYKVGEKKNKLVFVSRFIDGKGLPELFRLINNCWPIIKSKVPDDFVFIIAGYGELENYVVEQINILKNNKIPVEFLGYVPSKDILKSAKIVLSLQTVTNYPSRIVAESLLSGSHVLVLNSGDSAQFGEVLGLSYIDVDLDYNDISEKIIEIINDSLYDSDKIRKCAIEKFHNKEIYSYLNFLLS